MDAEAVIYEAERKGCGEVKGASRVILAKEIAAAISAAVAAERDACASIAIACDEEDERDNGAAMTGAAGRVLELIHERK